MQKYHKLEVGAVIQDGDICRIRGSNFEAVGISEWTKLRTGTNDEVGQVISTYWNEKFEFRRPIGCPKCGKVGCDDMYHAPPQEDVPLRPSVPQILREMASIYEERNAVYGDNYKNFGKVMDSLFPNGLNIEPGEVDKYNRLGIFVQIVSKLGRFANGGCTHLDSIRDTAVYSAMMEELIHESEHKA